MRSLSIDLRKRIIHWRFEEGREINEIAELAGCCRRTVCTILATYRDTGEVYNTNASAHGRPRILSTGDKSYILALLRANPSLFLDEIQDRLWEYRHVDVSIATISRTLRNMGISDKTLDYEALQRNDLIRRIWVAENANIPMEYIVWLDESGIEHEDYQREHGWGFIGQACTRRAIFLHGIRFSILPALSVDGIVAFDIFEGTVNHEIFIKYLREELAPVLTPYPGPNSVVIMDNARIHHSEEIRALIEDECNAKLVYLPPYSPDYNPAELAFSFIKGWLKRHESHMSDNEERWELIHQAVQAVTPEMAENWIVYCGYD